MPAVRFTQALRNEYESLFDTCAIRPDRLPLVEGVIDRLQGEKARYQAVGDALGIPWFFVSVIHNMESSLDFTRHLHNGDRLTARTVRVPAGRPRTGNPPFTWEESARDRAFHERPGTRDRLESGRRSVSARALQWMGLSPLPPPCAVTLSLEFFESLHERQVCCGRHLVRHGCVKAVRRSGHPSSHGGNRGDRVPGSAGTC